MEMIVGLFKKLLHWRIKILIKLILSVFPGAYPFLARFKLVRHGRMDCWDYALNVFEAHFSRYEQHFGKDTSFICLEIGCGDSVASGIIAHYFGAKETFLVDSGPYATLDPQFYSNLVELLNKRFPEKKVSLPAKAEELKRVFGFKYLTEGVHSLASIPSDLVDFSFSQAVLEHVYLNEFETFSMELYRVMKTDGLSSHIVDLRDHLAESLNNLCFTESRWESQLFKKSSFYTNRLRMSDIVKIFKKAGFEAEIYAKSSWEKLPILKEKLDEKFRAYGEEELLVSSFGVKLSKGSW